MNDFIEKETVAVVDDSAADRDCIAAWTRRCWEEHWEPRQLSIQSFPSGEAFVSALAPGRFSLVLMDCCMPGISGLKAAQALREQDGDAAVVFITSSRDYAVDGYQVAASGYLVKPLSYETFFRTLERVWPRLLRRPPFLTIPSPTHKTRVFLDEIIYCDADKHYVQLHLVGGGVLRARMAFSELETSLLRFPRFLSCYRGCIVNMDHVQQADSLVFAMDTGDRVPIRRRETVRLLRQYEDYLFDQAERARQ